ncbi:MAG: bifunctional folylpolyglutamate synthase/dihydrofolate synthase [candidate division Zixibacteria bacterium]|nr:bifunctional folylpolyglutamate synthase/dihydrofolate synthase [candidate division Zixibacteria bacterium]
MPTAYGGYKSALRFILSREFFGMKLGLDNISEFLDTVKKPQSKFASVHIAGTNGKGSTAAYIDSMLCQAGYKVGLYTSPHLVDFRERIRINDEAISKRYITAFINKYRRIISRKKLTFFEVCTAMAFCYFADQKIDIAIIETGLGGRLDATNTLTPRLSIITDISYDHIDILGNTLRKIAAEKAGIIKEHIPILIGFLPPPAAREITRVSRKKKAPLVILSQRDFSHSKMNFRFHFHHHELALNNLQSSLPGHHQIINAALSIRAIQILKESGFRVYAKDIRKGLKLTNWPGRFQIMKNKGKPTIILDVGHNPAGFRAMAECFRRLYPGRKADIVIGLVKNKDHEQSIAYLKPIARRVEIAPLATHRSADPKELDLFFRGSKAELSISSSITMAARKLINSAGIDDIIIVCGSHYGVGEFIAHQNEIYEK